MNNQAKDLKILADENILLVHQAFSTLGQVQTLPAAAITGESIKDADLLLVRSVTQVSSGLVAGSRVKFVGTATIGYDHIDLDYLKQRNIGFASAPGSNSNSVAEYVLSALFVLADRHGFHLPDKKVGIIGRGHVGSNLLKKLQALGVTCLVNDPPLKNQTGDESLVNLDEVFSADILTLHVPLVKGGPYPTDRLIDESFLERMKPGAVLINTSRGAVVDEAALQSAISSRRIAAVLDAWDGEPNINADLVAKTELATAHIAGYSYDGKLNGTQMIYEAACKYFNIEPTWDSTGTAEPSSQKMLSFSRDKSNEQIVRQAIMSCYDIRKDDANLRRILDFSAGERAEYFRTLRKNYSIRREFHHTEIQWSHNPPGLAGQLSDLGFQVKSKSMGGLYSPLQFG